MSDTPNVATLATLPDRFADPPADTLATLPKGGVNLAYMGHAEVTLALIAADPAWTWRPLSFDVDRGGPVIEEHGKRLVMWGYLTVCGVERLCVGTCEAHKGDPEKELIGDLLRNGAMRFGIGTKLWSKATDADPAGTGAGGRGQAKPKAPKASTAGITDAQRNKIMALLGDLGIKDRAARLARCVEIVGRPLESSNDLTAMEARKVIDALDADLAEFHRGFNEPPETQAEHDGLFAGQDGAA